MYKLSDDIEDMLVAGVRQGFKNYLIEREDKKKSMIVSSGYAWTRGSHMDDAIFRSLPKSEQNLVSMFGVGGWNFLRFNFKSDGKNISVIQKSATFMNDSKSFRSINDHEQNYISLWSNSYNKNLVNGLKEEDKIGQMALFDPFEFSDSRVRPINSSNIIKNIERNNEMVPDALYILNYSISSEKDIGTIKINAVFDQNSIVVSDLSEKNRTSLIEIPVELRNSVDSKELGSPESEVNQLFNLYNQVPEEKNRSI
ncbi:hypothetical protein [Pediococcus acidilactici]|uniref:hypothetical protein n=1 Tax=Pediococcus acidilactici TaxID=1254 RepID=UPI002F266DF6